MSFHDVPSAQRKREEQAALERTRGESRARGDRARSSQLRRPAMSRAGQRPLRRVGWDLLVRAYPAALQAFNRCVMPERVDYRGGMAAVTCACSAELPQIVEVDYGSSAMCTCGRVFLNLGDEVRVCLTEPVEGE